MMAKKTEAGAAEMNIKKIEKVILDLEQGKVEALRAGGEVAAEWFRRYYTDDVVYTSGNGAFYTKSQTVDEFATGFRKLHLVQHDDCRVRVYGNTAVLTYRGNDIMERPPGNIPGKPQLVRTTDVYVKEADGVWRIAVHHVTPVQTK